MFGIAKRLDGVVLLYEDRLGSTIWHNAYNLILLYAHSKSIPTTENKAGICLSPKQTLLDPILMYTIITTQFRMETRHELSSFLDHDLAQILRAGFTKW